MGQPKSRKLKNVVFNIEIEEDLFDYANKMYNFSGWVKQYLRMEMLKNTQGSSIQFVSKPKPKPIVIEIPVQTQPEIVPEKNSSEIGQFF